MLVHVKEQTREQNVLEVKGPLPLFFPGASPTVPQGMAHHPSDRVLTACTAAFPWVMLTSGALRNQLSVTEIILCQHVNALHV